MYVAKSTKMRGQDRSMRLWRCDFDGRGGAARGAPAAPHGANCVQNCYPAGVLRIKVEGDYEGAMVKEELDGDNPQLWRGTTAEPDLYFTDTGCGSYLKMEDDTDQTTIKQELDIGPTVLQAQAAPPDVLSAESVRDYGQPGLMAPRPSTSSGDSATTASLGTVLTRPLPRTDFEEDGYEEYSAVPCSTDLIESDNVCQEVSREQPLDRSDTGDMCTGTREYADKRYERDYHLASAPGGATLMSRVNTYGEGKPYECEHWECSTSHSGKLETHACTHRSTQRSYKCGVCEYSASKLSVLKIHERIHTGEKPYKCEVCEYSASHLCSLKRHMRIHTGEKPYQCEVCEYSALELIKLKIHRCIHTGEKPHKCELCEYSASRLGSLKRHLRIHTGEKPYKCELCEYSASQLGNLKKHIRIHTGEKPYKCELCEYNTSDSGTLKRHKRTHTDDKTL